MTTSPLLLCARQELMLALRSRWTQIFAVAFAALALAVASSGYILSGGSGVQDFSRTAVSLVQLTLLLVPLTSLVIGVLSLASDQGAVELLLSQPVPRRTILLGRLLGLFEALAAAQALGFGAAGIVVFLQAGEEGIAGFLLLLGGSLIMTSVFLGIAGLLAVGGFGRRRAQALALALVVWFGSVVLFDVVALGVASLLPSGLASRLLIVSVLVNPVDATRTGALLGIEGTAAFGPSSLAFLRFTGGPGGAAMMIAVSVTFWIVAPTILAVRRLGRADI
jgi:Cu-processing system permease protein